MDAAGSLRWGDGVMIRSQIPLSLPPVPPAHKKKRKEKIWRHTWTRGKPAAVNGPAVRVHLGGGGRAGVDYQSLRLEEPTPALQFSPDGREVCSFCSTTLSLSNLMFDCSETAVVLESRRSWRLLLDEKFLEHQKWSIHVKKIKNKSHGGICPRSSLNNPPFVLWYSGLVFHSFLCFSRSQQHVWACCQLFPLISFTS